MTEKLSNYTSQEGTLYPQMWCGTQKGPAKSPEQPLSFGCLTPSPVFFFALICSFVPFTLHFGNASYAGYLCLEDTYKNQSQKWPVSFTDTFFTCQRCPFTN